MMTRFTAALLALALPLCAQDPAAAESLFHKAYWLQNGERNFPEAMTLYEKFLQQAPDHPLVGRAAQFQFELLTRAGKTEDATAFAKKYEKVLGKVAAPAPTAAGEARGEGRGEGRTRGEGGGDMAARLAEAKKQLEEAKASGDQAAVERLERQIRRMEQAGSEGGAGGAGGRGQRGSMFGSKKLTEMNADELEQFKGGLERMSGMVEMMKERNPDGAKAIEENVAALKTALEADKLEDAR